MEPESKLDMFSGKVNTGYVFHLPKEFTVTPAIGLEVYHERLNGFREGGGILPMQVKDSDFTSVEMPISVSAKKDFVCGNLTWSPEIWGAWVPRFGDREAIADATYGSWSVPFEINDMPIEGTPDNASISGTGTINADASVSAKSNSIGKSYGKVGAALGLKIGERQEVKAMYDLSFSGNATRHFGALKYSLSF